VARGLRVQSGFRHAPGTLSAQLTTTLLSPFHSISSPHLSYYSTPQQKRKLLLHRLDPTPQRQKLLRVSAEAKDAEEFRIKTRESEKKSNYRHWPFVSHKNLKHESSALEH
jgi:hypothetical protein